ncbi:MAG TPA: hypothetical protein VFV67_18805 [Actinophytocola sp.]|uniref:hypothetical protein n=1 Tax=Actinophytocola sp. TaxID=1872138 RepID=UPI002DBC8EE2|nr:hypothetical protein [Actinophytocola sp.]HEU5472702.1 hypothetical protein [Actinophytocola sp.]
MIDLSRDIRADHAAELPAAREHMLPCTPRYRTIVAVDIAGSTTRANPGRARLRAQMYSLLNQALKITGITQQHHDPPVDRGDGALILIHACDQAPKTILLTTLIPVLRQLLADHNAYHPSQKFQLRAAVHAGEIHYDQWGTYGEAIDVTCRLLDAPELKRILTTTAEPAVLVVSDDIYRSIIRHGYDNIDGRNFHPIIRVEVAGLTYQGWVQEPTGNTAAAWAAQPATGSPSQVRPLRPSGTVESRPDHLDASTVSIAPPRRQHGDRVAGADGADPRRTADCRHRRTEPPEPPSPPVVQRRLARPGGNRWSRPS